jgi:dienelactone hydrolase
VWLCGLNASFFNKQNIKHITMKAFSRRNLFKSGLLGAAACLIKTPVLGEGAKPASSGVADGIPLNDILADYTEVNKMYGYGLAKNVIVDKAGWENKRSSILRRSRIMLGEGPSGSSEAVKAEVLAENARKGYRELKVQFPSGTGDMIKGFLLVPDDSRASSPRPAILAMHSTGPGATQTIGLTPKENRCYGMELAQRGYVVLAIDTIAAGERIYKGYEAYYTKTFYDENPLWSVMGKIVADHKRGLDYLCSLNFVDPDRLGCIGHSLGGYNSYFLMAFDSRIKAAVSSCGFTPLGKTVSPYQFARGDWFVHFNPACRDYIRAGMIPCDLHEFMSLCAPRPLFNYSAKKDTIYCPQLKADGQTFEEWWKVADEALNQVSRVYQIAGAPENFVRAESDGGHDFPPDIREKAFQWLDKWLKMVR